MSKEQYSIDSPSDSQANISEDILASSSPIRPGPYRSLSAKRSRDPSQRKSVQFNDVPIVHEVPSYDTMRSSNTDTYRSWAYTDATTPTSIVPSIYSPQILSPFYSSSTAAQKLHANRLSSALYSTPTTTTAVPNRIPDWTIRAKTPKSLSTAEETNPTNENNLIWNSPIIIVQTPDERATKETTKLNNQSTYTSPYMSHSQTTPTPLTSSSVSHNTENTEEKRHPYRSAMLSDAEHYRSLPYTYGPLSDSTATYTSMLNTHLIQSNHSSNEQPASTHTRTARARSAALPISVNHPSTRPNDTVSITPLRTTATTHLPNGSTAPTRTVLRPTTIAFQCSQPVSTTTSMNTITGSPNITTTSTGNTLGGTTLSTANTAKPPTIPSRLNSSAAAAAAAHSRFTSSPNRTYPTSSMASSAIKYAFAHATSDASLTNTAIPKPPPTAYPRSRSANVVSTRRTAASPIVMIDGQSHGGSTTNPSTNLYATTKRNPNVRQTYGSYYMHRVLLPTTTN